MRDSPFPKLLAQLRIPLKWADADGELAPVNWDWELPLLEDDGDEAGQQGDIDDSREDDELDDIAGSSVEGV